MVGRDSLRRRIEEAGFLPPGLEGKRQALGALVDYHTRVYGGRADREVFAAFVPGRVEVLGKHTDYAGGQSIVAALDRGFLVVASSNDLGRVRMAEDAPEFEPLDIALGRPVGKGWSTYVAAAAGRIAANFPHRPLRGMDCVLSSDLAVGSGMSGSSALMILVASALIEVNGLAVDPLFRTQIRDGIDLAMYLACAENGQTFRGLEGGMGVGTFGGSEDHTAILNGRAGKLSRYRYAPTVWVADMAWPETWGLAVSFSGVRAVKTREALEKYNLLSRRAAAVVEVWNRARGSSCATLREVTDMAWADGEPGPERLAPLRASPEHPKGVWDLEGRLRQFHLEDRVYLPEAWRAIERGDGPAFGRTVSASHAASREHLRNIAPEIDTLCTAALELGAWGASGFGAGFGGSAYAVLPAGEAAAFLERWPVAYGERHPERRAEAWFCLARPASGLTVVSREAPARWVDTIFGAP